MVDNILNNGEEIGTFLSKNVFGEEYNPYLSEMFKDVNGAEYLKGFNPNSPLGVINGADNQYTMSVKLEGNNKGLIEISKSRQSEIVTQTKFYSEPKKNGKIVTVTRVKTRDNLLAKSLCFLKFSSVYDENNNQIVTNSDLIFFNGEKTSEIMNYKNEMFDKTYEEQLSFFEEKQIEPTIVISQPIKQDLSSHLTAISSETEDFLQSINQPIKAHYQMQKIKKQKEQLKEYITKIKEDFIRIRQEEQELKQQEESFVLPSKKNSTGMKM